jgi:hypothetical protein
VPTFLLQKSESARVPEPKNSPQAEVGFPSLNWEDEDFETRPMPLHERPVQARIDAEMALIARHHTHVAVAITRFWGHRDCVHYIESLVLSGVKEGEKRMGFKPEVLTALMTLAELHNQTFGVQGRP